jgi:hypothetical protein
MPIRRTKRAKDTLEFKKILKRFRKNTIKKNVYKLKTRFFQFVQWDIKVLTYKMLEIQGSDCDSQWISAK